MKDPKVQAKYFKEFKTKKIYSPTIFWEKLIKKNFNLIIKGDIKNFRNLNAGFVGFAPYFSELKRYKVKQNFINNINKLIENSKIKPKGRKKISFLINSVLTGFERANTQYKLLLTDDIEPKFHEFNESKVGNPTEQFRFNKKFFSASSLNYLNGLLFLKKYIKSFDNKIIMEIGGGFGSVGEILYKLKINNFKYINLDLPPLNIVSEYYLENSCKEIIGNHFLYKKKEKIFINKMRKLNCLPNFDIDKINGKIDIFINFISFQEMELKVVENYLNKVKKLKPKFILLRNLREGKNTSKKNNLYSHKYNFFVEKPIKSQYYKFLLKDSYFLLDSNVEPYGHKTWDNYNSELLLYKKK